MKRSETKQVYKGNIGTKYVNHVRNSQIFILLILSIKMQTSLFGKFNPSSDVIYHKGPTNNYECFIECYYYLKLASAIFYQIFVFSPNDSALKTMKNIFYFI